MSTDCIRDYSHPIRLDLKGKDGFRAYVRICKTPKAPYDSKAAAAKAAENLKRQGLIVQ